MFQCTFITCMGKGILPLRYNDIKKLRVKILLWMETVTHMSYWCSHFIDLVVKEHAHKTSESLILFYGEMSGKFGKPSGDSRRAFGHCRKTHREHSESLRVILGEYSDIVVKRILTTRGFRDVSRFWNSGGWQVCKINPLFPTVDLFIFRNGLKIKKMKSRNQRKRLVSSSKFKLTFKLINSHILVGLHQTISFKL